MATGSDPGCPTRLTKICPMRASSNATDSMQTRHASGTPLRQRVAPLARHVCRSSGSGETCVSPNRGKPYPPARSDTNSFSSLVETHGTIGIHPVVRFSPCRPRPVAFGYTSAVPACWHGLRSRVRIGRCVRSKSINLLCCGRSLIHYSSSISVHVLTILRATVTRIIDATIVNNRLAAHYPDGNDNVSGLHILILITSQKSSTLKMESHYLHFPITSSQQESDGDAIWLQIPSRLRTFGSLCPHNSRIRMESP